MSSSSLPGKPNKKSVIKLVVIAALSLLVAVSALPRYVSSWPWATPLLVPNQSELQAIRDQGIPLPGWQTEDQLQTTIGGDTWSIQQLSAASSEADSREIGSGETSNRASSAAFLLLRPQIWEADQPEVEWLDIKGSQRWQTDSHQKLSLELPAVAQDASKTIRINADFFRAQGRGQTYAILQWYAWPTGGSPSPSRWFWADQMVQWRQRQRLPWVAVSVWLPIEPFSKITAHSAEAEKLGESVHSVLLETIFPQT